MIYLHVALQHEVLVLISERNWSVSTVNMYDDDDDDDRGINI
jgi:hypothetical protein